MLNLSVVAIIPARGGSKGVPGKNIRPLSGHPLIAHSILDAKESNNTDKIFVSTDDEDIASVARQYGAEVIYRPSELANDTASSESALIHALSVLEKDGINPDLLVFLQCTSPIRTGADIDHAIEKIISSGSDSLLSVSPSHRFLWEIDDGAPKSINYDYQKRPRRQDMKPQYVENGSIYIFKPWVLKELGNRLGGKVSLFVMDEDANWEIDSVHDFEITEHVMTTKVTSTHVN